MSVMTQGKGVAAASVMFTVPVGVAPDPLTVTCTETVPPAAEGSGESLVMLVVLGPWLTVWLAEVELLT